MMEAALTILSLRVNPEAELGSPFRCDLEKKIMNCLILIHMESIDRLLLPQLLHTHGNRGTCYCIDT